MITLCVFLICESLIIDGTFKPCTQDKEIKININKKGLERMGDILEKKTLDYFYTYPVSTRRYTTLYVNNGKIYQTKCQDDISKITIVDENQNPNEQEECWEFVWIKYLVNDQGFLDCNGVIRQLNKPKDCSEIVNQKFHDSTGIFIFTRNQNKISVEKKGIF